MSYDVRTSLAAILAETPSFPHGRLPSDLIKSIVLSVACLLSRGDSPHGGLSLDAIFIDERGCISLERSPALPYFAPERCVGGVANGPSPADDIWALGCVLLQLVENRSDHVLPPSFPLSNHKSLSPEGLDFLTALLHPDPARRATATQISANPFLRNRQSFFAQKYRRKPLSSREKHSVVHDLSSQPVDTISSYSVPASTTSGSIAPSSAGPSHYDPSPQRAFRALFKATRTAQQQRTGTSPPPPASARRPRSEPRARASPQVKVEEGLAGSGWSGCQSIVASCDSLIQQLASRIDPSEAAPSEAVPARRRSLSLTPGLPRESPEIHRRPPTTAVTPGAAGATPPTKPHAHSAPLPRQAVPPSPAVPTTAQSTPGKPVFEGQAAASAKRIRTWLNHLSGNLMSPVGKSAASSSVLAPSISDADFSRQAGSVVYASGGRDPLRSATCTESVLSQDTLREPLRNLGEDLEREVAPHHSPRRPATVTAGHGPHPPAGPAAPTDSPEYKLQRAEVDASPARQSQATQAPSPTPTLADVEEALHHLLHSSAYLSQSLGTDPAASPAAAASRRTAQLFLTTAAAQCAARNENPSPDSSTSFVMEKLQDLCTAVRGFDTWDLEQAILNLDFSVPEPQMPPPFQLDLNLLSPPARPSPLQRPPTTRPSTAAAGSGRSGGASRPTPTSAPAP
eukprot:EG_transcript_5594